LSKEITVIGLPLAYVNTALEMVLLSLDKEIKVIGLQYGKDMPTLTRQPKLVLTAR